MVITIPLWAILSVGGIGVAYGTRKTFKYINKSIENIQETKNKKFLGVWYPLYAEMKKCSNSNDKKTIINIFLRELYSDLGNVFISRPICSDLKMTFEQREFLIKSLNSRDRDYVRSNLEKFLTTSENIQNMVHQFWKFIPRMIPNSVHLPDFKNTIRVPSVSVVNGDLKNITRGDLTANQAASYIQ